MDTGTELIVERRRLRRRLTFWRIAAVLLAAVALLAVAWPSSGLQKFQDHVARVRISGIITGDKETLDLLGSIAESDRVKAVILHVDSPGGTTSGSEAIFNAIREIAKDKPVIAVMDTVAASGGYIVSIAADRIVARGNTITGSIGVIFSFPELSRMLDMLGISVEEIKSGELKAEPSPYKPMSDKARQAASILVQDAFNWFVGLVAERRKLSVERVRMLADGRVYTGRQAVSEGLIDALGDEESAVAWLEAERKIEADAPVLDWSTDTGFGSAAFGSSISDLLIDSLGLSALRQLGEGSKLDGLLALWHPGY